ncbi:3'-5' exonuclease [Chitinivorax sp. B]|uniref:3'-5' exonuclease n=1 Tax=Chitinivorax sp. B TaxID=2502235 RepID=UPI0010F8A42C|nr:3'-5' exonuclease [Chitinivorax sp. B]
MKRPAYYLIIDFEATCCNRRSIPSREMEIIEIGAAMVQGESLQVVSTFQSFIRPIRHARLTTFCTELTSITQADVDAAPHFTQAVSALKAWLGQYPGYLFGSWGDYDRRQLQQDCGLHQVPYPIASEHLNVKKAFAVQQQLSRAYGLGQAIQLAGLQFAGTQHRGIDDALNIVRLLPYALGQQQLPDDAERKWKSHHPI